MSKINNAVDAVEGFTCAVEDIVTRVCESEIAERAAEMTEVLAELGNRLAALEQWVGDKFRTLILGVGRRCESDDDEDDDKWVAGDVLDSEDYHRGYDDGFEDGKASAG